MMLLIFVVMWLFMIRPQQKKQKELAKFRNALQKGDKIVTIGGIHGTVVMVKDKTVIIKVDDSARIEFNKSAISSVVGKGTEKPQKKDKDGKEAVENKGGEAGSIGVDSAAPAAEEKAEEKNEDKTDK